jgi:NAD-dependent SIR2 family protein deacetylase
VGKICRPFIVLECSRECGFSRLYNEPTEEQEKEIADTKACPACGAPVRRRIF